MFQPDNTVVFLGRHGEENDEVNLLNAITRHQLIDEDRLNEYIVDSPKVDNVSGYVVVGKPLFMYLAAEAQACVAFPTRKRRPEKDSTPQRQTGLWRPKRKRKYSSSTNEDKYANSDPVAYQTLEDANMIQSLYKPEEFFKKKAGQTVIMVGSTRRQDSDEVDVMENVAYFVSRWMGFKNPDEFKSAGGEIRVFAEPEDLAGKYVVCTERKDLPFFLQIAAKRIIKMDLRLSRKFINDVESGEIVVRNLPNQIRDAYHGEIAYEVREVDLEALMGTSPEAA